MIINQWVPAAHRGDAIGDSARRVRDILRAAGHQSDLFALTMDGAGVLFDDSDPLYVAALMDGILSNTALQDEIVEGQIAAVRRLQAKDFAGTLLGFVDRILSSPRAPEPEVAFDFWQQFDAAEELEALRQVRPSAYKGLPEIA